MTTINRYLLHPPRRRPDAASLAAAANTAHSLRAAAATAHSLRRRGRRLPIRYRCQPVRL